MGASAGAAAPRASFVGDPYTVGDTDISLSFTGMTPGSTWAYTISSDGGGTDVTDTGTSAGASFTLSGIDISGLSAGTLTLTVTEDAAPITGDTAVLSSAGAGEPIGLLLVLTKAA